MLLRLTAVLAASLLVAPVALAEPPEPLRVRELPSAITAWEREGVLGGLVDGIAYLGGDSIQAIRVADGETLWAVDLGAAASAPIVHRSGLVTLSGDELLVLRQRDGRIERRISTPGSPSLRGVNGDGLAVLSTYDSEARTRVLSVLSLRTGLHLAERARVDFEAFGPSGFLLASPIGDPMDDLDPILGLALPELSTKWELDAPRNRSLVTGQGNLWLAELAQDGKLTLSRIDFASGERADSQQLDWAGWFLPKRDGIAEPTDFWTLARRLKPGDERALAWESIIPLGIGERRLMHGDDILSIGRDQNSRGVLVSIDANGRCEARAAGLPLGRHASKAQLSVSGNLLLVDCGSETESLCAVHLDRFGPSEAEREPLAAALDRLLGCFEESPDCPIPTRNGDLERLGDEVALPLASRLHELDGIGLRLAAGALARFAVPETGPPLLARLDRCLSEAPGEEALHGVNLMLDALAAIARAPAVPTATMLLNDDEADKYVRTAALGLLAAVDDEPSHAALRDWLWRPKAAERLWWTPPVPSENLVQLLLEDGALDRSYEEYRTLQEASWHPDEQAPLSADEKRARSETMSRLGRLNSAGAFASALRTDDGRLMVVWKNDQLGSEQDYWLAVRQGESWTEKLFLGPIAPERTGGPPHQVRLAAGRKESDRPVLHFEPRPVTWPDGVRPKDIGYKPFKARELVLDLDAARRDRDRDGLSDEIERRLGLDPMRADTDGDGHPDAVDLAPLSRVRDGSPRVRPATEAGIRLAIIEQLTALGVLPSEGVVRTKDSAGLPWRSAGPALLSVPTFGGEHRQRLPGLVLRPHEPARPTLVEIGADERLWEFTLFGTGCAQGWTVVVKPFEGNWVISRLWMASLSKVG